MSLPPSHHLTFLTESFLYYLMDIMNQKSVYYDLQRDVSVSGYIQSVTKSESHMIRSANSYVLYLTSVQRVYSALQHQNHYYNYPQVANDSSVQ
jgi:SAC3 family protein LENG8/THP3